MLFRSELHLRHVDFTGHSGRLCALLRDPGSWHQLRSFTFTAEHCEAQHFNHFFSVLACAHSSLEHLTFRTQSSDPVDLIDTVPLHRLRSLTTSHNLLSLEGFPEVVPNLRDLEVTDLLYATHLLFLKNIICCKRSFPNLRRLRVNLSECSIRQWLGLGCVLEVLVASCEGLVDEVEVICPTFIKSTLNV